MLTRDDEAHPLIKAMHRREPTYFDGQQTFRSRRSTGAFTRVPLRADDGDRAARPAADEHDRPGAPAEVTWLAGDAVEAGRRAC